MSDAVEFRHLKYIVAIAETGNFTRAVERLFVSQPSLSKQIKEVEEEIGFQIFTRTPDGVFATPVGQMIVDYATATLYGRQYVLRMAKEIFLGNIPPLRMGFSSFVAPRHLQIFKSGYASQFPKCVLQYSGGVSANILQRLERGELDCAIIPLPVIGSQWNVTHLAGSPLVVCMRVDAPLAEHSIVTLSDLAGRLTISPRSRKAIRGLIAVWFRCLLRSELPSTFLALQRLPKTLVRWDAIPPQWPSSWRRTTCKSILSLPLPKTRWSPPCVT